MFIVIIITFRPIYPSVFFWRFMSNSGVHRESRIEPFKKTWRSGCGVWLKGASEWNHLEVVGSIPTTGKTNKEYLRQLNTCIRSWLKESEQSTPVVQIKGSVRDSMWTPKFNMKHLKTAERHSNRNVVIRTIKMRNILRNNSFMIN